ncbi:pseudouridine synthase [Shewanella sp. UCD-FRSSP16_17]|uniref:pseudouridine synthase n=1 Tax=Shewanella sp. UCD-FRSSP16_17 TaxID=1853256 RepID=UPI0007EECDA5|nr:pseudouridine synthase [Shewanella sp. UCD-FRSSP16_17]OBT06849.1 pseudouridine synthase [Shewanella sp. UCD-FRSSP16_17]
MSAEHAAKAAQPSYIVLPQSQTTPETVLAFLVSHFKQIPESVWIKRVVDGKVHWADGEPVTQTTKYRPATRVYYYREVESETKIPFQQQILHQDEHCILVFKPHFLPVTPSGNFVNECLIHRLRITTGIDTISPAHRLDRPTAGVMLMTVNPESRHAYHALFTDGKINKQYQAIAKLTPELLTRHEQGKLSLPLKWTVKNRMVRSTPSFLMKITEGEANTHSEIRLIAVNGSRGLFELSPITGKMHQLRVHMMSLGMPLENDTNYPRLQPKATDDFTKPLRLIAKSLTFEDPFSQQMMSVNCEGYDVEFGLGKN